MASETRTSKTKVTFELSKSLREKFTRQSKKLNTSVAQRLRDYMQSQLKKKK